LNERRKRVKQICIIKGAIFDLDGTLIDSMGVWNKIDYDFLAKRGISLPEDLGHAIKSLSFKETALYFKDRFNLQESIEDIMNEWSVMAFNEYAFNIKLKPGVDKFLSKLKAKGIKIALATVTGQKLLKAVLENNGIFKYFDAVSTTSEVARGKSFPDIYLLSAEKLGLKPEECVVFEDILPAVLGAKAAGMKVIGVYDKCSENERHEIEGHADRYICSFNDLNASFDDFIKASTGVKDWILKQKKIPEGLCKKIGTLSV
jgi:HAD superfamily hydrolase (TIGR01509 family)